LQRARRGVPAVTNAILSALPKSEQEELLRAATRVPLKKQRVLQSPNRRIENIYFVEDGLASVIAVSDGDTQVEVGIVGREGVTGISLLHGVDRSPYNVIVQMEGTALKLPATHVQSILRDSEACRNVFLRFAHVFMVQTSQTAIANARATIPQRLARWLLMAQDRVVSPDLPLTHEFLSVMMGVRRAGVSNALSVLAKRGVVEARRGSILILERDRLESAAGRFYGVTEKEFARLIG
jgi:CRP-like cAMP-binding protein